MYEAERDPYCYPGTDVLKNKAGLTSAGALERFETAMTFARSEEPLPHGRLSFFRYPTIDSQRAQTAVQRINFSTSLYELIL